jgi:hypothetical protein
MGHTKAVQLLQQTLDEENRPTRNSPRIGAQLNTAAVRRAG